MSYSRRSRYSSSPSPYRRCSRSVSRSRSLSRSPSRSVSSDAENPGNNLYVTGLSSRVTEGDLKRHFSSEGKVEDISIVVDPWSRESRGFGFVTMSRVKEADRCIKYLNNSVLQGRAITVEKARRRRGRTPTPGRYLGLKTIQVRHRSSSYSPDYRSHNRFPRFSSERSRSRSRSGSYSPYHSHHHRSESPYYNPRSSYSAYRPERSYSQAHSPYGRSPISRRDRSYSPRYRRNCSPDYGYRGRCRYRSVSQSSSPRVLRYSRRNYSPGVLRRWSRSYSHSVSPSYSQSVSPPPQRRSRRSYSRSVSPKRNSSRRSYSRSISPRPRRSGYQASHGKHGTCRDGYSSRRYWRRSDDASASSRSFSRSVTSDSDLSSN